MTKRKDKDKRVPKYQRVLHEEPIPSHEGGMGKSILLLVEGETEQGYFESLKQNQWLSNNLAGVTVEITGNLGKSMKIARERQGNYEQIWLVHDNDKRNAFIIEEGNQPFFTSSDLPKNIVHALQKAYSQDKHAYFLSMHDYLAWLSQALGPTNAIEFWDRVHFYTPKKPREFAEFDKEFPQLSSTSVKIAYSCLAFEYWIVLHFQQACKAFIWNDKEKNADIDLVTFLRTIPNCQNYQKGKDTYQYLFNTKPSSPKPTKDEEWGVLHKILTASKNAEWLREKMQPILKRQVGKWYEVNPYILGWDELMFKLMNVHRTGEPINFFGLTLEFEFSLVQKTLKIRISVDDGEAFTISNEYLKYFEIRSANKIFRPANIPKTNFPNDLKWVLIDYPNLADDLSDLILIFKDFRNKSKSHNLFIHLNM